MPESACRRSSDSRRGGGTATTSARPSTSAAARTRRSRCCGRRDNGYWKIVSWQTGFEHARPTAARRAAGGQDRESCRRPQPRRRRARFSRELVHPQGLRRSVPVPVRAQLRVLQPHARSRTTGGRVDGRRGPKIRAAIERAGQEAGTVRESRPVAVVASNQSIRPFSLMYHRYARTFALTSLPTSLADALDCATRAKRPGSSPA